MFTTFFDKKRQYGVLSDMTMRIKNLINMFMVLLWLEGTTYAKPITTFYPYNEQCFSSLTDTEL